MKTTKQMAMLGVIALFTTFVVPVLGPGMKDDRLGTKTILSVGRHQALATTPHIGGQIPPCPSGAICN